MKDRTDNMIEEHDAEWYDSSATETIKSQALSEIQHITARYVSQLLYGCGDSKCLNSLCDTGRRNCSQRPVRTYTPRSARAIAITLAAGPQPRSRLCKELARAANHKHQRPVVEGARDHAAFEQLLSDTRSVRDICQPTNNVVGGEQERQLYDFGADIAGSDAAFRKWRVAIDSMSSDDSTRASSVKVMPPAALHCPAETIYVCIRWLLDRIPPGRTSQWKYVIELIGSGCVYPDKSQNVPCDPSFNNWIYLLDALEHGPSFRLFCRVLEQIAQQCALQKQRPIAENSARKSIAESTPSWQHDLIRQLAIDLSRPEVPISSRLALIAWLKKAFLRYWDSNAVLPADSVPFVALSLLKSLLSDPAQDTPHVLSYISTIGAIARRMNIMDMATTWQEGPREQHLLAFSFIFNLKQQVTYFRGINFARMLKATLNTRKVSELRSRHPRPSESNYMHDARLKFLEENYLLLNVSRGDVLKDAFDQLWQRRRAELFRPLRVRLGEMDTFEVGHDLGGVQIEFFNLLCKELFRESAQMFTTDPTTGYSYFRPGSLQPLYMFEMCGLAFALALYNGISLPVNFPQAFYLILTDQSCDGPSSIADAWPIISRSLTNILQQDVPGMERTFPLEANGLRLTVLDPLETKLESPTEGKLYVLDATPIVHHEVGPNERHEKNETRSDPLKTSLLDTVNDIAHAWPGWHLLPSSLQPAEVTSENKATYVQAYIDWVTFHCIQPQWTAFLRGFRYLFDPSHLHTISTWKSLRSIFEGSPDFHMRDLRAITQYEYGYDTQSKYIQSFWRLVTAWPMDKQRALLKFVTACERVPAGGAGNLTFRIKRAPDADAEQGKLPTSSTCFGTLILPKYESVEVLDRKLSLALKYGVEGFGSA